jgi:predicted TIM-barrel fold metal-dependent hydrolase
MVGRFVSVDPLFLLKYSIGLNLIENKNLYSYSANNPSRFIDSTGMNIIDTVKQKTIEKYKEVKQEAVENYKEVKQQAVDKYNDMKGGAEIVKENNLSMLIPHYGKYGGPKWSSGFWGFEISPSMKPIDIMDGYFLQHDTEYNKKSFEATVNADMHLVVNLVNMEKKDLPNSNYGKTYRYGAIVLFSIKYTLESQLVIHSVE